MTYLGFYWTLPVLWAGFTSLPDDADEAARLSRTIRYQVDRVRRWVKDQNGRLAGETVFMDSRPDRATDAIICDIDRLLDRARAQSAEVVLVDFSLAYGWRPHGPLFERLAKAGTCVILPPEPATIDGKPFDPVEHFRAWRALDAAQQAVKAQRKDEAQDRIAALKSAGTSLAAIAADLNGSGLRTVTGRRWTADNVRKFMAGG